jgi:hypothetical protein
MGAEIVPAPSVISCAMMRRSASPAFSTANGKLENPSAAISISPAASAVIWSGEARILMGSKV